MSAGELWTLLGFLVGGGVFWLEARRRKLATEGFGWVAVAALCGGVVGARVAALLATPGALAAGHFGWNGKALFGGIAGGWLCVEIVKRRLGLRRSSGDLFALALPAGEAVGRIGCFLNGCCFGLRCDASWAVYQHGAWRHPAQLYASGIAAAIFALLLWARPRMTHEGDLFRLYLLLFAAGRFALEWFRERTEIVIGLSLVQLLCVAAIVFLVRRWKRPRAALVMQS